MELSALLTKKAALVGGGTAATTTAVVVPIAVTQSNKEDGSKSPSSSGSREGQDTHSQQQDQSEDETPEVPSLNSLAQLDLEGDNFYDNFNKPGYCIRKLFLGIEKSDFFQPQTSYETGPEQLTKSALFSNEEIENACYTYNKKTADGGKVRLELSVQSNNEGWFWMAGLKPKSGQNNQYDLWYKEAHLKKENHKWIVYSGHEGEIPHGTYTPQYPNFSTDFAQVPNINPTAKEPCGGSGQTACNGIEARIGYWNNTTETGSIQLMAMTTNASGNQIAPWSGKHAQKWDTNNRKHVFLNGKWHENIKSSDQNKAKLIEIPDLKVPHKKGKWKDPNALCKQESSSEAAFNVYCK